VSIGDDEVEGQVGGEAEAGDDQQERQREAAG